MYKYFIILLLLANCNNAIVNNREIKFNPDDLSRLKIDTITTFWKNDSLKESTRDFFAFDSNPFIGLTSPTKNIAITVFASKNDAVNSMTNRIKSCQAIVHVGVPNDSLDGNWWYIQGIPYDSFPYYDIFLNRWNTIIEVSANVPEYKETVIQTVIEIYRRIDNLSIKQ
jgi:hypothetical protein